MCFDNKSKDAFQDKLLLGSTIGKKRIRRNRRFVLSIISVLFLSVFMKDLKVSWESDSQKID